jgi:hypothetical protein
VEDEIDSANAEAPGETLRASLKVRDESTNVLRNRENSQLEFKESFNLGSLAKYSRN